MYSLQLHIDHCTCVIMAHGICVLCLQKVEESEPFSRLTQIGWDRIQEFRIKWNNIGKKALVDNTQFDAGYITHKSCYSSFTNKSGFARCQKSVLGEHVDQNLPEKIADDGTIQSKQSYEVKIIDLVKDIVLKQNKTMDMDELDFTIFELNEMLCFSDSKMSNLFSFLK